MIWDYKKIEKVKRENVRLNWILMSLLLFFSEGNRHGEVWTVPRLFILCCLCAHLFLRYGWQKDGGRRPSKAQSSEIQGPGHFTFPRRMKGGLKGGGAWALDDNNEESWAGEGCRALVCVFGDVLSGSHLHTVGCNKGSDYAGSSVRTAAPLIAGYEAATRGWYICWWLLISHITRDIRADKAPQTKERSRSLGSVLSRVALSLNLVVPI